MPKWRQWGQWGQWGQWRTWANKPAGVEKAHTYLHKHRYSVPKPSSTEGELHGGPPLPQPLRLPRPSENHPPASTHNRVFTNGGTDGAPRASRNDSILPGKLSEEERCEHTPVLLVTGGPVIRFHFLRMWISISEACRQTPKYSFLTFGVRQE